MKKLLIVLAAVAAFMLVFCILVLSDVIPLGKSRTAEASPAPTAGEAAATPVQTESAPPVAAVTEAPTPEPSAVPSYLSDKLSEIAKALTERDAKTLTYAYHESYWLIGGSDYAEAVDYMQITLDELGEEAPMTFTPGETVAATPEKLETVRSTYASYGVDASAITEAVTAAFAVTQNNAPYKTVQVTIFKLNDVWYLFDDISQLLY